MFLFVFFECCSFLYKNTNISSFVSIYDKLWSEVDLLTNVFCLHPDAALWFHPSPHRDGVHAAGDVRPLPVPIAGLPPAYERPAGQWESLRLFLGRWSDAVTSELVMISSVTVMLPVCLWDEEHRQLIRFSEGAETGVVKVKSRTLANS